MAHIIFIVALHLKALHYQNAMLSLRQGFGKQKIYKKSTLDVSLLKKLKKKTVSIWWLKKNKQFFDNNFSHEPLTVDGVFKFFNYGKSNFLESKLVEYENS